jgi:hypothetical protein
MYFGSAQNLKSGRAILCLNIVNNIMSAVEF